MIIVKIMDIFSCYQICETHNIAKIEEDELCHLMAEGVIIRLQHLILFGFKFVYIIQLYKDYSTILRMLGCRDVAVPITRQNSYYI